MNKGPSRSCQNACWVSIWLDARSIFVFFFIVIILFKKERKKGVDIKRRWERKKKYISVPPYIWLYIPSSAVSDINDEYPLVAFRLFPPLSLTHFPSRLSVRLFFFFIGNCYGPG